MKPYESPSVVTGVGRLMFIVKVSLATFFYYLRQLLTFKRSAVSFVVTLRKLRRFAKKQQHGKLVRMNGKIRMGLYIPSFPSRAFFRAGENMFGNARKVSCVTAVVSITSKCCYDCDYCYQKLNTGQDLALEKLVATVRQMQDDGVAIFVIEGGEPFSDFSRLTAVCDAIDGRSEIWVNTTGAGVTQSRLALLRELGVTAYKISVHDLSPEGHNRFLKSDEAWDKMRNAISLCVSMSIPYAFNSYMSHGCYLSDHFEKMMDLARDWKASYIQCLTPRSSGANLLEKPFSYTKQDLLQIASGVKKYNRDPLYRDYPAIFFDEYEERCVIGCTAGGAGRIYVNAQGELQPCHALNISYGNVGETSYLALRAEMGTMFQYPKKKTACTVLSPLVAKHFSHCGKLPVSINVIKPELSEYLSDENV